jgi:hypothetical protein
VLHVQHDFLALSVGADQIVQRVALGHPAYQPSSGAVGFLHILHIGRGVYTLGHRKTQEEGV